MALKPVRSLRSPLLDLLSSCATCKRFAWLLLLPCNQIAVRTFSASLRLRTLYPHLPHTSPPPTLSSTRPYRRPIFACRSRLSAFLRDKQSHIKQSPCTNSGRRLRTVRPPHTVAFPTASISLFRFFPSGPEARSVFLFSTRAFDPWSGPLAPVCCSTRSCYQSRPRSRSVSFLPFITLSISATPSVQTSHAALFATR